jgi:hypothetical protein
MIEDDKLALFLMVGQTATRTIAKTPDVVPQKSLMLSTTNDLAVLLPERVRVAHHAAEAYMFFFVFEGYMREFVIEVLSSDPARNWWDRMPTDVQTEVTKLEETEEVKRWMALGSRDKSALMTYPQLLRVIDHCWKDGFEDLLRDKTLIQEARAIGHLRNTLCHMTDISVEEMERVKQTMRDWFRMVAP